MNSYLEIPLTVIFYTGVIFFTFLFSGHAKSDSIGDKKASQMDKLLANIKLDNQFLVEQQPLRGSSELFQRREFERRRPSLPSNPPQGQQPPALRQQRSEPLLRQMNQSRELKLG